MWGPAASRAVRGEGIASGAGEFVKGLGKEEIICCYGFVFSPFLQNGVSRGWVIMIINYF